MLTIAKVATRLGRVRPVRIDVRCSPGRGPPADRAPRRDDRGPRGACSRIWTPWVLGDSPTYGPSVSPGRVIFGAAHIAAGTSVSRLMRLYDYVASANCYKARLLLAQLERPYERVPVDIFGGDTLTDEFAAKNPARSTPVLETDEGRYLQESNAILWYLADGTPFLPEDAFDRAHVLKWLILEQTDVMPGIGGLRFRVLTGRWAPDDPPAVQRRELGRGALAMLEQQLADR